MGQTSPTDLAPGSAALTASVEILTLPEGVYSFTIEGDLSPNTTSHELVLPALQVGLAPARSQGTVEFLTGSSTLDRWLAFDSDMIVARILGGDARLLLTSLRAPDSPVLDVKVNRLNAEPVSRSDSANPDPQGTGPQVRLLAHIRNVGDLEFMNCWAGWAGQHLPVEAFSVALSGLDLIDQLDADDVVEYRGITADGLETPWLSNEELCGSRGTGLPMVGFAVRLKSGAEEKYDCDYSGKFFAGGTVGPFSDGTLCCSDQAGDPLEAIAIRINERAPGAAPSGILSRRGSGEA